MYYDGANWKWDEKIGGDWVKDTANALFNAYQQIRGDEMDESLVTKLIADLDKITNKIEEIQAGLKVEKKDPNNFIVGNYCVECIQRTPLPHHSPFCHSTKTVEKKAPCHPKNSPLMNIYDKNGNLKSWCEKCGNYYEEKKEQRKLAEVIGKSLGIVAEYVRNHGGDTATIDAVIECYYQWKRDDAAMMGNKPFPEYLKEKML